jgi:hypothetical protein
MRKPTCIAQAIESQQDMIAHSIQQKESGSHTLSFQFLTFHISDNGS